MKEHIIKTQSERLISCADFGDQGDVAVIHCHGGPGSRFEAGWISESANAAGLRLIGISRPGYGGSTVQPGRSIADSAYDVIAVADQLGIDQFFVTGSSTGGAYALAIASIAPERVLGVVVCCGMSDMRIAAHDAMMDVAAANRSASDREAATLIAIEQFGEAGEKLIDHFGPIFSPVDVAFVSDPAFLANDSSNEPFQQGVYGYVDDRIADSPTRGWSSFDVENVNCPVLIIHGEQDLVVPLAHAHHTSRLVRGSKLRTYAEHGHMTINMEVVSALTELVGSTQDKA
jgi:pimeloyl-ACP methyl ester carboxylesterase